MNRNISVGEKIGRLTIIRKDDEEYYYKAKGKICSCPKWICHCDCGNNKYVSVSEKHLKNVKIPNCGCVKKEAHLKSHKKYNKYDLSGEYGIGWTSNANEEFYFDLEDYDKIKDYCWSSHDVNRSTKYVATTINGKRIYMHRIVINPASDDFVDHRNHNGMDNRKINLRVCSHAENSKNMKPKESRGIRVRNERWSAYIQNDNQLINLGTYATREEALAARLEAEKKYYGEFSYSESIKNCF